jgi:hypothetical protein
MDILRPAEAGEWSHDMKMKDAVNVMKCNEKSLIKQIEQLDNAIFDDDENKVRTQNDVIAKAMLVGELAATRKFLQMVEDN